MLNLSKKAIQTFYSLKYRFLFKNKTPNPLSFSTPPRLALSTAPKQQRAIQKMTISNTSSDELTQGQKIALKACQASQLQQKETQKYLNFQYFIQKIFNIYKMQKRLQKFRNDRKKHFSVISSTYNKPIKRFLDSYSLHHNEIGYNNGEQVSATLQNLQKLIRIQGKNPNTFGDFNFYQACNSHQMKLIINDLKYCLEGREIFFAPLHFANTLCAIQKIGYRDTELYKKLWNKVIDQTMQQPQKFRQRSAEELFDQANVGGQQKWRNPGYYVYKGFEDSQVFNQMYKILMQWQCDRNVQKTNKQESSEQKQFPAQQQEQYNHILKELQKINRLSIDSKSMQTKLLNSLTNLRRQYYKVMQQLDKRKFLRENPYIFYDILELQEQLVESGIVEPQDLLNSQSYFQSFQTRMKKAADSFYQLAGLVFPQALSPNIDEFYTAAIQSSKGNLSKDNKSIDLQKQQNNKFTPKILARCLESLASMTYSNRKDFSQADDKNGRITKILPVNSDYLNTKAQMKRDKNIQDNQDLNRSRIPPHFTSMWEIMRDKFKQISPVVLTYVESQNCDLETLIRFHSAFGKARIGGLVELNKQINKKLDNFSLRQLNSSWNAIVQRLGYRQSSELLVNFINNRLSSFIESRNIERIGVEAIWNKYQKDVDGDNLFDLQSAINTAWAYTASWYINSTQTSKKHVAFNKSLFINLVSLINRSNLLDAQQSASFGECLSNNINARKINDIVSKLEVMFEKQLIQKYANNLLNVRQNIVEIDKLQEGFYNPIKGRVSKYVQKLLED